MLEADDVHAGNLELHGDALVLDRDVEGAVAVHVGSKLTVLILGASASGQRGQLTAATAARRSGKGKVSCA